MSSVYDLFWRLTWEERLFVYIALSCLTGAILFIAFLITSRLIKNNREAREVIYRENFQGIINNIILADSAEELESSWQLKDEIKKISESPSAKRVLIHQMIALKKSLSGVAVENLEYAYRITNLFNFSFKKLNSISWTKQAQGIYEFGEMNYAEAREKIKPFLQSTNPALRDEAFMALMKLDKDAPLSFLDDYKATVSLWMRMRIHHHLSHIDKRQLPDFSRWFLNPNIDVALFAISMARQFRQLITAPKLVTLLRDSDKRKVSLAVTALGELEAFEYADKIIEVIDLYWTDDKVSRRIATALGKLSSADYQWKSLARYLQHPDYVVRYEAVRALHQSQGQLLKEQMTLDNNLRSLVAHIEEPLLQTS